MQRGSSIASRRVPPGDWGRFECWLAIGLFRHVQWRSTTHLWRAEYGAVRRPI
jgi:hypothetical protein